MSWLERGDWDRPALPGPATLHPKGADRVPLSDEGQRGSVTGSLSLEAVMVLPVLAVMVVVLLQVAALIADVLVLHEGARAGVRAAATTTGTTPVIDAVQRSTPELSGVSVVVHPEVRGDGDLVRVEVSVTRQIGPLTHRMSAAAHARVEPAVGTTRQVMPP